MIFFTHVLLLVSVIGAQANPILPMAPESTSKLHQRAIHPLKRSPGEDIFNMVLNTVKRSLSEIESPQEGNVGGHLMKRMVTHFVTRNEHDLGSTLVDELTSIIKRSDELTTAINSLAEYTGDFSKDRKQVVNALFENGAPKILKVVLEILQESDIIKDIMAIVSKVTKAVVQRIFSLGKDKPAVGSKAEVSVPSKPETPSTASKAPASNAGKEAASKEASPENAVSDAADV